MTNETVLEMHYHRALMDTFRQIYGIGAPGTYNFYKYSPKRECFIGFDQAYIKSELSEDDMFNYLKDAAANKNYNIQNRFIGYFLQFKVVKKLERRSKYTPSIIQNQPHYRVSLDTIRNPNTNFSQHEMLYMLSQNHGAMVYYACPMIFDRSNLYDLVVNLDELQLADLSSCPSPYCDNNKHYIYYERPTTNPYWCSEPSKGISIPGEYFIASLINTLKETEPEVLASNLLNILTDKKLISSEGIVPLFGPGSTPSILPLLGESLTIIQTS